MLKKVVEFFNERKKVKIDDVIQISLEDMIEYRETHLPDEVSEKLLSEIERLYLIHGKSKKSVIKEIVLDPNTVILVLGGIAEILLIMNYEKADAIVTKAFTRVIRPRI